jgi:hypothetical protein
MVTIYTGRIGKHYVHALDITVKSGQGIGVLFAPTWELVCGHKAGKGDPRFVGKYAALSDEQYAERFLALLRTRYQRQPQAFAQVLERDYCLTCFCAVGCFCHRLLVAELVLPKIALKLRIEYHYGGEV